jgi:hypothetical protein
MKKQKTSRKKLEQALDIAWSIKVRSKGFCAVCGPHIRHDVLHAHHIFSRKHKGTRWDLQNGVCLCPRHHLYHAHKDIMEFGLWCIDYFGQAQIDRLRIKAMSVSKWHESDLQILLNELQS